jgi:outer membrane lipase/esterase
MVRNSLLPASLLVFATVAHAGSITQIVSFGDSLTDNGNALAVYLSNPSAYPAGSPVPLPPNYTAGRFTDGPDSTPASKSPGLVWVEDLASEIGVAAPKPFLASPGGTNFAIGGAQTGTTNPQDMGNQVGFFLGHGTVSSSTLFTFWGGANDLFAGGSGKAAADNIFNEIQTLAFDGGRYFLWLNLAPIEGIGPGALQFNAEMATDLATLQTEFPTDVFVPVNVAGFILGGAGGLINCTAQQLAANPDQCLLWDGVHPTNVAHQDIANLADAALNASIPTPEPAVLWTTAGALLGFVGLRRRKRSA